MQVSIVNYSEVRSLFDYRIDSDYWHPDLIQNSKLVSSDIKIRNCVDAEIKNIKSSPINKDFEYLEISSISLSDGGYQTTKIDKGDEPDRAHYILHKNDVAVSTVRPNRNAVAFIDRDGLIGSSGLAVLRANSINPKYLYAFCKTNYFIKCLIRANKATMYPAVSNNDILSVAIIRPSISLETSVIDIVAIAFEKKRDYKSTYQQAQDILLTELGLTNWKPKHQLTFIKSYSDVQQAERIDAEYYQPKYDDIITTIKAYNGGWDTLESLVKFKKCVEVGSSEYLDEGIPFVRVSNISSFEITEEKYISEKLYETIKQHQPQKNEILLSKDATPGIAHYLNETPKRMILSSGIIRLKTKSDKVNNEYLSLVLSSILTKEQVNRDVGGSVILHWRPDQIKEVVIPILPKSKQLEIQQKVTESIRLRKQSRNLLENAKRAVEIAIEQDEQTAIKWLQNSSGINQ